MRHHAAGASDSWSAASGDEAAAVRRRAAELAPLLAAAGPGAPVPGAPVPGAPNPGAADPGAARVVATLVALLDDADVTVVEAAAWALGELGDLGVAHGAVAALARVTTAHTDALAREGAVAALGALGDGAGLAAILTACTDKPAVRRRAVLALASFDGPDVDAALDRALEDRDWQVRQAAEDLRGA